MQLQQAMVLLLAACIVCCHAHRGPDQGYEEEEYKGGYKGEEYKDKAYKDKQYDEEEYSRYNYNYKERDNPPGWKPYQEGPPGYNPKAYENYEYDRYGPPSQPSYGYESYGEYEREGYGGYEREGYGEDRGYEGYGDNEGYGEQDGYYSPGPNGDPMLPCKDPHKWPYAWWTAGLLCVDPSSGVQSAFNATTCKGPGTNIGTYARPKVCVQWPGTNFACTFETSPMTKPCRKASDVCDQTEFCPGTTGVCPSDVVIAKDTKVCRWARGPCETNAYCDGSKKTCPASWVPSGTKCRNSSEEYGSEEYGYGYDAEEPFKLTGPCDAEDVCTGNSFICPNTVQPKGNKCGAAPNGACDVQDVCDGVTDKCKDAVAAKGTVCNAASAAPCILGGKCDGKAKTCPALKHAPTGTPCNKMGLFKEAMDAEGKVALKSRYSKELADMHGWAECDRCYEGECQTFKWEYWNADKHGDGSSHKSTTAHKTYSHKTYSHKTYSHKTYSTHKSTSTKKPATGKKLEASAYAAEEAEAPEVVEFEAEGTSEYYPTQIFKTLGVDASIQSSYDYASGDHKGKAKNSYEPEVYCHNPYTRKDYS